MNTPPGKNPKTPSNSRKDTPPNSATPSTLGIEGESSPILQSTSQMSPVTEREDSEPPTSKGTQARSPIVEATPSRQPNRESVHNGSSTTEGVDGRSPIPAGTPDPLPISAADVRLAQAGGQKSKNTSPHESSEDSTANSMLPGHKQVTGTASPTAPEHERASDTDTDTAGNTSHKQPTGLNQSAAPKHTHASGTAYPAEPGHKRITGTGINRLGTSNLERASDTDTDTASDTAQYPIAGDAQVLTYIVLDDDPTGTQSVADLPVLTAWTKEDFRWGLEQGTQAIYVMTNSRSLSAEDAARVNREVVTSALEAAEELGQEVAFVSRSDSTLRGHYPLEPDTIANCLPHPIDGVLIVPAFPDAGRITVYGTHYARDAQGQYVRVGETEFARDATFGFKSSTLPEWVAEKSQGRFSPEDVLGLNLDLLRGETSALVKVLLGAKSGQPIAVDATCEEDLRALSLGLIEAERAGKRFIYRVGPPFVRARIGQEPREPLTGETRRTTGNTRTDLAPFGLVVVGSHVDLTTRQLNFLRETQHPTELEIEVAKVLDEDACAAYLRNLAQAAAAGLEANTVVVRTSRVLVKGSSADDSLRIARAVSAAVVSVVNQVLKLKPPKFVIAKGGITSSDVASKGLEIRRAWVLGPMLPGIVSAWAAAEGPARDLPYIVFAGNVGDETSLAEVVAKLQA